MSQKKQIFKLSILKKLLADENSCVSLVPSTRLLGLPPFFLTDMKSGILYLLNSMLKKYDRSLGGIVIGYQNIKVLMDENTGIIPIGTSEMEVNISVEFYIFQPKIGNYLEGVVNKKSNNHIGCLVHQYFNATILKSEDVLYEDWICKDLNVDDKIVFKVKDLDFTTLLPYIEGIYDGKISLDKVESRSSGNCDINNVMASDVNKGNQDETSFSGEFLNGRSNSDGMCDSLGSKQGKNEMQCKDEIDAVNATRTEEEKESSADLKIKQKKKKKKEKLTTSVDDNVTNEEKNSDDKVIVLDGINNKLQDDDSLTKKKKKKKKRKESDNNKEGPCEVESVEKEENSTLLPSHIQEKIFLLDENSNDFVKTSKSKKEKKKSKSEESVSSFNKINEEVENSILYSTQLDPVLGSKKMRISFCSPIPRNTPLEGKAVDKSATPSLDLNNRDDAKEKEKKKKHKKREREKQEESVDSPVSKKIKLSNTEEPKKLQKEETKREVNGTERKSIVQIMMEQMYQEQLNRVRGELRMSLSDRESLKEEKKKKKKKKEVKRKKRDKGHNESVDVNENTKSQLNGGDRRSELQNTFSELCRQELKRVKEEFSMSENENFKKSKKKKSKKRERELSKEKTLEESCKTKETKNAQFNCTNGNDKKSDVRSTVDELYRQEIDRMRRELSRSHSDSVKEKKKKKSTSNDLSTSREGTHDSLYAKLLNEAKNAMDLEKIAAPVPPPATEWGRKKKDSELSDISTSSSFKKDSKKKSKQKLKDCFPPPSRYKNGSMYDIGATPEKINPDKSLFSDSEQSHSSPIKKKKGINGVETELGKSKVQNMLEEFYREEMKRLKNESDRESQKLSEKKAKKRKKAEEKSQVSSEKESLYEKLLKEAKSLVDVRELSLPVKKEKKSKKNKNGEGLC